MEPTIYIFRGAPASGKGTIVPRFCELLPKPVALIEQDTFRWGFHLVGRDVQEVKDEEHSFAYKNMMLVFEEYLKNGRYNVVLEGLFTWNDESVSQGSAEQLVDMAKEHGFKVKSIILKADKAELLERNSKRHYSVPIDEFEMLYSNIYKTIGSDEIVIDSSSKSLEETLESLKAVI